MRDAEPTKHLQILHTKLCYLVYNRQDFLAQWREGVFYSWRNFGVLFLFNQSFTAQEFQLVDKHLLADAGNGTFEFSVTDYSAVDLEDDEQCPLSGENLHRLSYGTFIV